ncbi:MAG: DUF4838 domain-containing protein [Prevotellaceae bacterium]|nr:DUF4838 domain-containing protein [Prevotellaceae bacterium]
MKSSQLFPKTYKTMQIPLIIMSALLMLASCGHAAHRNKSKGDTASIAERQKTAAQKDGYDFEYRALCTPTNNNPKEFGIEGTNNVDNDWSLWGHNLWKIVGKKPPKEVFALIENRRDSSQYCFSSPALYGIIDHWIADQWGPSGGRFTIMPADNKKVCQCPLCRKAGNTASSATPAVAAMLDKLARKYPRHQFFMTAYHTTKEPPAKALPDNAGVMLSTMAIPMRYSFRESGGFRNFDSMLQAWRKVTPLLYVWEYDRNFDDYLTPYPCLMIMQQRLQYYKEAGITGVFINGSGYDYSTFDDVQTYVLARLLQDVDTDVDATVREFYKKYYPLCGEMIADYYLTLEYRLQETNYVMPYYGTIKEAIEAYLDPKEFTNFWISLDSESKAIKGTERQYINRMLTATSYTRLQLNPSPEDRAELLLVLKDYKSVPGLLNYKETNGALDKYLKKMGVKETK